VTPSNKAVAITPSDTTDLTGVRAIYVGGTGALAVRLARDPTTTITFSAVPVGTTLELRVTRVMAASTATLLVGLY
jgi:hypothetical protein